MSIKIIWQNEATKLRSWAQFTNVQRKFWLVWDLHKNDSEFLPVICRKKKCLLDDVDIRRLVEYDGWGFVWEKTSPHYERRRLGWRLAFALTPWVRIRLIKALFAFVARPYFSRVSV